MSLGYESKNYESKKKIDYFYFKTIIEYSIDFTKPLRYTFYIVAAVFVLHFASPTKRQVKEWETFLII